MSIIKIDSKEEAAQEIARAILESEETDVTVADISRWHKDDVYEWIEAWGYQWDKEAQEWYAAGNEITDDERDYGKY